MIVENIQKYWRGRREDEDKMEDVCRVTLGDKKSTEQLMNS